MICAGNDHDAIAVMYAHTNTGNDHDAIAVMFLHTNTGNVRNHTVG